MRRNAITITLRESDKEKITAIHDLVIVSPGSDHSLKVITKQFGINRFTLTYGFKQMYSISIHRYVIQERIRLAQQLLKETDKQVKEIAGLCGYKRIENFSRVFKKEMGVAPSELRK